MRADRIRRLLEALSHGLYERDEAVRLGLLAAIAGENLFLFGPPGVGKSMIPGRIALAFTGARRFEYLLGEFTTPDELFGPVSITRLKEDDAYERAIDGYLPTAEIVCLDEIWNASDPVLNTLLKAISERRFRNGKREIEIPLWTVIATSGGPPPEESLLDTLWDRFLLRLELTPIRDQDAFLELLCDSASNVAPAIADTNLITSEDVDRWQREIASVGIPEDIQAFILDVRERISRHNRMRNDDAPGITVSDRRWKQIVHLLRTSAFLNDRSSVDVFDCVLLRHCLWSREDERDTINTILEETLFRYSTSGRFDVDAFRDRLAAVLEDVRSARYELVLEPVEEPVEYRGEYYRVTEFVEDHQTLIWIGDYENLATTEPVETDLFFYGEEEDYAYSERFQVRRIDSVTIEIAGEEFTVETTLGERESRRPVEIAAPEQRALTDRLTALRAETENVLESIRYYRETSTGEAMQHLFVHRSYADIVTSGMDHVAQEFSALQLDIDDALSELA